MVGQFVPKNEYFSIFSNKSFPNLVLTCLPVLAGQYSHHTSLEDHMRLFAVAILLLQIATVSAQTTSATAPVAPTVTTGSIAPGKFQKFLGNFGMNYFTFWEGPSLQDGQTARNDIGRPLDDGLSAYHHLSITYKLTDRINLDQQTRVEHVHTNDEQWRFQGMRLGISGKLLSGDKWSLKGAANTDIPGLNGRDAGLQTVIFNPGLFAGFHYQFNPRWSFYSIVSPRIYFYREKYAVDPQWTQQGRDPGLKRSLEMRASPTINYAINDKVGLRSGLDLNFRSFVKDEVTELNRWPTGLTVGPTFNIHKALNVYAYVQTWPFDGQKMTMETASLGMWVSGVLF
jgi:hypothetical protein